MNKVQSSEQMGGVPYLNEKLPVIKGDGGE